jgi:hypothetical protein
MGRRLVTALEVVRGCLWSRLTVQRACVLLHTASVPPGLVWRDVACALSMVYMSEITVHIEVWRQHSMQGCSSVCAAAAA